MKNRTIKPFNLMNTTDNRNRDAAALDEMVLNEIQEMLSKKESILADESLSEEAHITEVDKLYQKAESYLLTKSGNKGKYVRLMLDHASFLEGEEAYRAAEQVYLSLIDFQKKNSGEETEGTAFLYHLLSGVYEKMEDIPSALEWNLKTLAIREKLLGPLHEDTASACLDVGSLYMVLEEKAKAREYLQKAKEGFLASKGPDSESVEVVQDYLDMLDDNQEDTPAEDQSQEDNTPKKKSFWQKLFGIEN